MPSPDWSRAIIGSTVSPELFRLAKSYCRDRDMTMNEFLDKSFEMMLRGYSPSEQPERRSP